MTIEPKYPTIYPYQKCLDKGFVALVDWMGNDLSVARAARVKPEDEWRGNTYELSESPDAKLIDYMVRNAHTTPFEKVTFTFWVKAPIFVYRQWHRHRTWSYNEQSARYQEMDGEFYVPDPMLIGSQSKKNHQSRIVPTLEHEIGERTQQVASYEAACNAAVGEYRRLLSAGWPRELARAVLPVSIYSEMEATVNLHNLFRFLDLRLDEHAQYEIRVYAKAMLELIERLVPVSVAAWRSMKGKW